MASDRDRENHTAAFLVHMTPELRARLHRAAKAQDLKANQLVRRLIREHVEQVEQGVAA